jgi:hypothetical protein
MQDPWPNGRLLWSSWQDTAYDLTVTEELNSVYGINVWDRDKRDSPSVNICRKAVRGFSTE